MTTTRAHSQQELRDLFHLTATAQRGAAEKAMIRVQFALGGGVLNPAVEHIGDLLHRMTERTTFDSGGYEAMHEKVTKAIRWLEDDYGFEREVEENIVSNARHRSEEIDVFRARLYHAMDVYAAEHRRLPAYNKAQEVARSAAVAIGERRYQDCLDCLHYLAQHLKSREAWLEFAHAIPEESYANH